MRQHLLRGLTLFAVLSGIAIGQQSAAKPTFMISDVHDSPRMMIPFSNGGNLSGDRYNLRQSSVVDMIALAYGVKLEMVQGGPS